MIKSFRFKKFASIFTALMLVLSLITPMNALADEVNSDEVTNMKQIDVICFNDFHGSVQESGKNQGIAKVAGEINKKKAENPNTIVVAAGDNFQGSAMSNLTYGAPVNEFMKAVGVTASAVGNHDFDWGVDKITKWAEEGGYDFLASNIYDKTTGKPVEWAKPYKIVEMDGVKVGFIGFATPETEFKTKPENVANLEFKDPVAAAKEWTKTVRENGADVVIALTHIGSFQDRETKEITGNATKLCGIEGLDAVISAHTHQAVCGVVNGTPIVQPYKQGRAIGYLSIMIDENGKVKEIKPSVDFLYKRAETVVEDKEVKAIYEKYIKDVEPILNEVVGYTENELSHDRWSGPSVLGEWVCDVMRKAAGTQIGLTNGGGLRCPIPQGDITMGTLYEVMPFDNTLYKMEIKGSDLKKNIEHGINNDVVGWLEIAGVYVKYNNDGKVTEMTLEDGTPIEMDKYYTAVTNDFMFTGGDNYDFSGAINHADMNVPIRDALVKELKEVKKLNLEFKGYLPKVATANTTNNIYVVKLGDTLGNIAAKYNVSVKEIVEASEISNAALIFPGDKLVIPGAVVEENDNTYTVKSGDTLGSIGQQYGLDYKDLAEYNNIEDANLIFVNQKILIPVK